MFVPWLRLFTFSVCECHNFNKNIKYQFLGQIIPIITHTRQKLGQHRPLSPAIVKNLQEDLIIRWTYHSNAIEGNALTLLETKVVLEGIIVGGKALREHFEAINHRTIEMLFIT